MLAAALTHLTDVVQGLQGEMTRMHAQMASSSPFQGTSAPQTVPAAAPTAQAVSASQVTGKLKLPQPIYPLAILNSLELWRILFLSVSNISSAWMYLRIRECFMHQGCLRVRLRPGGDMHALSHRLQGPLTLSLYGVHSEHSSLRDSQ
jgi:hypothetical protein